MTIAGPSPADGAIPPAGDVPAGDFPAAEGDSRAAAVLQGLVLGAAGWVLATSLLASVLGALGLWTPWLVLPLEVALAVGAWLAVRGLPARAIPRSSVALLVAVTVGGGLWASVTHSEQVLPRRDSASNFQAALSLADTHRRVVPVPPSSIGAPDSLRVPGVTLASSAFYQVGSPTDPAIQPQFVIGPAAVYSLGSWLGGATTMFLLPAWAMALGILAIALLAGTVIGPRWGPLVATSLWLAFPMLHVARSTYSEPLATLTMGSAVLALVVAVRAEPDQRLAGRAALLAGLLVGGSALVRIDALSATLLLAPVATVYAVARHGFVRHLVLGALVGAVLSLGSARALAYGYLATLWSSLVELAALGALLVLLSLGIVAAAGRGVRVPERVRARVPDLVAGVTGAVVLALATRPWWQTPRQYSNQPVASLVATLQQREGLAVDGARTYAERSVVWLSWWLGPVACAIAAVVLVILARRLAATWRDEGRQCPWAGPLLLGAAGSVLVLYRPAITPDHPWADRRLVDVVIPTAVLLIVAGIAAVSRWAHARYARPFARVLVAALVAVLLLPELAATRFHAGERVEAGELAAVEKVCGALPPDAVVLAVDPRASGEWPQVVRGLCRRPALALDPSASSRPASLSAAVTAVAADVAAAGGRLVLLAASSPAPLRAVDAPGVRQVVDITVHQDEMLLMERPDTLTRLPIQIWLGNAP